MGPVDVSTFMYRYDYEYHVSLRLQKTGAEVKAKRSVVQLIDSSGIIHEDLLHKFLRDVLDDLAVKKEN